MGIVLLILVGVFVGWLGAAIAEVDEGVFVRMAVGTIGAMLGGLMAIMMTGEDTLVGLTWAGVVFGLIGAALLIGIFNSSADLTPRDSSTS